MHKDNIRALEHPFRRLALICVAPLLVLAGLSMACNSEMFEYGEHFRATEEFVKAQSTSYAQSVRAAATSDAPAISATSTAIAQYALKAAPDDIRSLYDRFGVILVQVPAGDFIMGQDLPDLGKTAKSVQLDDFWIGLTEVTNAQYAAFVDAGGYQDVSLWTEEGWQWRNEQYYAGPVCGSNEAFNAPNQPVTCVTLYEAEAFAAWLARDSGLPVRLPTAEEWEKAARGTEGIRYPWGDEPPDARFANFAAALGRTAPVGSSPDGASPYGLLDMAGNVAEWTSTQASFGVEHVVRGGSWFAYADSLAASQNDYYRPEYQQNLIGFRLVAGTE